MPSRFDVRNHNRLGRIRQAFAVQLPLPCWRCGVLIRLEDEWDLGHRVDLAHGGADYDVWPEHRYAVPGVCVGNRGAGSQVRHRGAGASRKW